MIDNSSQSINNIWVQYHSEIEEKLASGNDIENFLKWMPIKKTMHVGGCNKIQFDTLRNSAYWNKWENALIEDSFGNPTRCQWHRETSYAAIYHAYTLSQIRPTGNVSDIKSVFEFGGGYGSMSRLIHRLGFNGTYTIYDLPALSQLQDIYLSKVGVKTENITLTTTLPKLEVDLFIAEWSIAESPIELRNKVFENINFKECVISFYATYGGYGNIEYFDQFVKSMPNYEWKLQEIEHLPKNYYLTARKKK